MQNKIYLFQKKDMQNKIYFCQQNIDILLKKYIAIQILRHILHVSFLVFKCPSHRFNPI